MKLVLLALVEQLISFETKQRVVEGGDGAMPRTKPPVSTLSEQEACGNRLRILKSDLLVICDLHPSPQRPTDNALESGVIRKPKVACSQRRRKASASRSVRPSTWSKFEIRRAIAVVSRSAPGVVQPPSGSIAFLRSRPQSHSNDISRTRDTSRRWSKSRSAPRQSRMRSSLTEVSAHLTNHLAGDRAGRAPISARASIAAEPMVRVE